MPDNFSSEEDTEYIEARIKNIGFLDTMGLEGAIILKSIDGVEFPIVAFSGEVAGHIALFQQGKKNDVPTMYNLVEEIAVMHDLLLIEVRIYQSDSALRANLYFQNRKKEIINLFFLGKKPSTPQEAKQILPKELVNIIRGYNMQGD